MNLEFLNPEYFIFLVIIPIIILWNYFNRDKLSNSIKFSNSEAFGESGNFYSKLKSILKYLRLISIILDQIVITTEKDFTKLRNMDIENLFYLPIEFKIHNQEDLLAEIANRIAY